MKKIDEKFEINVKVVGNEQNYDFVLEKDNVFEMINERLKDYSFSLLDEKVDKDIELYYRDWGSSPSLRIKLNHRGLKELNLSENWSIKDGQLFYGKSEKNRVLIPNKQSSKSNVLTLKNLFLSDERIEKAWDGESSEFTYTFTVPLNEWVENITKLKAYS